MRYFSLWIVTWLVVFGMGVAWGQPEAHEEPHLRPSRHESHGELEALASGYEDVLAEMDRAFLTGSWGGRRACLLERGLDVHISYAGEFWTVAHGGIKPGQAYQHLANLHLDLDLDRMGVPLGGLVHVDLEDRRGGEFSAEYVGDLFLVSNLEADRQYLQLTEYWWQRELGAEWLWFKLGKMDANADFQAAEYAGEFLNSVGGALPNIPMPTFPDNALGVMLNLELCAAGYVRAGFYDGEARGWSAGFDTAFYPPGDYFLIAETGVMPQVPGPCGALPGTWRVGVWHHSGEYYDHRRGGMVDGHQGLYVSIDQTLYRESAAEDNEQGLGLYCYGSWTPHEHSEIADIYSVGCQYVGLLPCRDADVTGLAWSYSDLSDHLQETDPELADEQYVEWFYKLQVTEAVSLKPDLQYIANPGGNNPDALVFGTRVEVEF